MYTSVALMYDVNQCPVCTCPHSDLDQTDVSFQSCDTGSIKAVVKAAQDEHLDAYDEVNQGHHDAVS